MENYRLPSGLSFTTTVVTSDLWRGVTSGIRITGWKGKYWIGANKRCLRYLYMQQYSHPPIGNIRMGSMTLEKVRSEALNLSEAERAELASNLVVSLDGPPDADVEKAWDVEILRRLSEIDAGTANLIDRKELQRRIRARMNRP